MLLNSFLRITASCQTSSTKLDVYVKCKTTSYNQISLTKIRTQKGAVIAIQGGGMGEETKYSENDTLSFVDCFLSAHSLLIPEVSRQIDCYKKDGQGIYCPICA